MILVKLGCRLFSVLTVTPSKIKIETIQYRRSRILEMKDDKYKYEKSLAKSQVCAIFHDVKYQSFPWRHHVGIPLRGTKIYRAFLQK